MKRLLYGLSLLSIFLSGCSSLPHSGPSASALDDTDSANYKIVDVTPEIARHLSNKEQLIQRNRIQSSIRQLEDWGTSTVPQRRISIGSKLILTIWSHKLDLFHSSGSGATLHKTVLGTYRINRFGEINLPYLGVVNLQNKTLFQAERFLTSKYQQLGQFFAPTIQVSWAGGGDQQGILVSGKVAHPGFIPWHPGGMGIDRILAQAGVSETEKNASGIKSLHTYPVLVSVFYQGRSVDIPLSILWKTEIMAVPGEKFVVRQSAQGHVTVLGGGISHPGTVGLSGDTSLAQILSECGGLNPTTADDRSIFILQTRPRLRPILYGLRWTNADGLQSSDIFPLQNGEVIYIPTAPVVPLEKAVQIFSGFLMPPALLANAFK